jgi:hypothetical protein
MKNEENVREKESEPSRPPHYDFIPGEQVLWLHRISKGFFHREVVQEWIITNMRAMKRFPASKNNPMPRVDYVGLAAADCVVINQRRQSQGTRVGNFVGFSAGEGFAGVTAGSSRSISRTYGDVAFFVKGVEYLRFSGISDPQGVHRMIETVKKQIQNLKAEHN